MSKFKVGDYVQLLSGKKSSDSTNCGWVSQMDALVGKVEQISDINIDGNMMVCGWWWVEDWVMIVESSITNQETDTMSLVQKIKKLALTSDEKLLRKWGFRDENGNWTDEAEEYDRELRLEERLLDFVNKAKELDKDAKDTCAEAKSRR